MPVPLDDLPYLLTVDELRQILRRGRNALYDDIRAGRIPGIVRLGRKIMISRVAIERLLAGEDERP